MLLYKQTNELKTVNHLSKKGWKVIGYSTTIDPRYNNINHHYLLEKPEATMKCPTCGTKNQHSKENIRCWNCKTIYSQRNITIAEGVKGTATYYTKPEPEED